mgnify:FL=1
MTQSNMTTNLNQYTEIIHHTLLANLAYSTLTFKESMRLVTSMNEKYYLNQHKNTNQHKELTDKDTNCILVGLLC